ncbi:AsmA family protein [Shimia thalassica]|uniref:AsmA family protein n=1 Tax=Shimia thalassica TaxID=1715693 RepID=UPI0027338CFE|nr:AsmA family protein [Shimia thalassica]MDP2493725.1 AsmA family protein [Shimia thalassica]
MRLIRVLLMVVVVVCVGLVALVLVLPGEKIARIAADQVKAQTGRDLNFEGDVGISWYPVLGISTGAVTLSNADWSTEGPMLTADSLAIGVDVAALVTGDIRIKKVEALRPDVVLEVDADGRANWSLFPETATTNTPTTTEDTPASGGLFLEKLTIKDARLRYVEAGTAVFEMANSDVSLDWAAPDKPADVTLVLRPAGEDITASARLADLPALLGGEVAALSADVMVAGATLAFEGRAGLDSQAAGQLTADVPNPDKVLKALGQAASGQIDPFNLRGQVTLTKEAQLSLRDTTVMALGNTLTLQADVFTDGERPKVNAQIAAGVLDLSSFAQPAEADVPAQSADSGWSKEAIDASALGLVDGSIAIAASGIDLGDLTLGASRMAVSIDRSRAVFALQDITAYGGKVTGEFVANNRNGLSVGGKIRADNVEMKTLLSDAMKISRFAGKATAQASFLGVGNSVYDIMNTLKGSGSVDVGQGTISGIDLDRLLRSGVSGGGTTVFDSLSATLQIEQGVLSNDDLLLDLPSVQAKGEGVVGLGQRTLDYLFTPQIKRDDQQGLAIPVRINGSWDDPKIRPQLDKALGVDLEAEKERLKDEAETRAQQEISERLNLQPEVGQSTEDAIKDSLEDKAKSKLLELLGGD